MNLLQKTQKSTNSTLILGAVIYFIINLIQASFSPLIDDEAYYFMWSQKLAWGYFDHPPMIAWWDALGFSLFNNQIGLRLFTLVFGSLGYLLLGIFLVKNKKDLTLFNLLFFSMVLFQVFGFVATPDAPLLFFSILYLILLYFFIQKQTWLNTLFLGTSMALVMYSKYHGALLITFSLLPLIPVFYKNFKAYAAIVFALILFSPHLLWQFENDFISANYHLVRRNVHNTFQWNNPVDYLLSIIYISSPFLFYFLLKPLLKLPKDLFKKSLWFVFWLSIGFFLFTSFKRYIQAQWSLITVIPLFILGFDYLKNNPRHFKTIKTLSLITISLLLIGRIYYLFPNPPIKIKYHGWEEFMKKAGKETKGVALFDRYQTTSLYSFYNYPKRAYNYVSDENRTSQYQLWDDIQEIDQQTYTYFSPRINTNDSIIIHSGEDYYFKYQQGEKFNDVSSLWFHIKKANLRKGELILEGNIHNNSNKVKLLSSSNFNLYLILNKEKFSREIEFETSVSFDPKSIQANSSVAFSYLIKIDTLNFSKFNVGYLSIAPKNLPKTIRSNYIKFAHDEND